MRFLTLMIASLAVAAGFSAGSGVSASKRVVHSATGSGHAIVGGKLRTFAFTARAYSDGSVKGQAQIYNRSQPARSHLTLNCLAVSGHTAYASGIIDRSTNPTFVGKSAIFAVRDNGEGRNAPPDLISLATVVFSGFTTCTDPAMQPAPTITVERGNIQVR